MARTLTIKDIEAEGREAEFWAGWTDDDEAKFRARMKEIDAELAAERAERAGQHTCASPAI